MASASVSRQTAIATRSGWVTPAIAPCTALVLDRFGKVVEAKVTVTADALGQVVFLGSRKGFGAFAGTSRVVTANGLTVDARSIACNGNIGDTLFEATLASVADEFSTVEISCIWDDFMAVACHHTAAELVIRCGDAKGPPSMRAEIVMRGDARYLRLNKGTLRKDFSRDWKNCVMDLCNALFADVTSGTVSIPAATPLVALWYLTACISMGTCAIFNFDSLQYSSFATVTRDTTASSPIVKGGTGFIAPTSDELFALHWTDNTLNPMANGFILASG